MPAAREAVEARPDRTAATGDRTAATGHVSTAAAGDVSLDGALPNLIVIGAMKCGTTALHHYLDSHPQVTMAARKETNFFTTERHRGLEWYASLFDPSAVVRGESSPGYTSPDHHRAARQIAELVPSSRLVYLVRDPVNRAISQFHHHQREGAEHRSLDEALLDPDSQYVGRSRYFDRLLPFLDSFASDQILIVVQERLYAHRRSELRCIYTHAGVSPDWWSDDLERDWHVGSTAAVLSPDARAQFLDRVRDDTERLRTLMGDDLPEWCLTT